MKSYMNAPQFLMLRFMSNALKDSSFPSIPVPKALPFFTPTTYSTICQTQAENSICEEVTDKPKNTAQLLKKWGCTDDNISNLFSRRPSLRNANVDLLQTKLNLLRSIGVSASDLVKIVNIRPRFLSRRIFYCFDERLTYFTSLFGSRELLHKAIIRNPSLLTYDFHRKIKPAISLYEQLGIGKRELVPMLLSRPTIIPRSSFTDEKMEYIQKTGVSKDSKMYKYVVTLIGISCLDTIRLKLANLEKFGIPSEEILALVGRSPLLLTLSIDKVQRNMTFILGTMKLPAKIILGFPFLLFANLDRVLKPRVLLVQQIQDMGLEMKIERTLLLRALRMSERRFLKYFVKCYPQETADELMAFYERAKEVKRLAESSRRTISKGFPF